MRERLQNWLGRKTATAFFIPEIDGFRFFAIFTVLLYHLNTHVSRVLSTSVDRSYFEGTWIYRSAQEGGIGVNVFFAISGFILALPFARQRLFDQKPPSLKSYYRRRLTRLEPPYLISLVILLLVHLFILHEYFGEIFPNFLASLFYLHNIIFDQWSKINPVAWSLEVEVQFYLLAPAMAIIFSIKNPTWRRAILVAIIIASIVNYNLNYDLIHRLHLRKSLLMVLHQFLIGFLFADLFLTDWKEFLKKRSFAFDLVGMPALILLLVFNDPFNFLDDFVFVFCLLLAFVALFKGRLMNKFFTNRWIVIIGGMCYSIYLLHYALIALLAGQTKNLFVLPWGYSINFAVQMIVILPLVLLACGIFFVVIERPCMDKEWPSKLKARLISLFAPPAR